MSILLAFILGGLLIGGGILVGLYLINREKTEVEEKQTTSGANKNESSSSGGLNNLIDETAEQGFGGKDSSKTVSINNYTLFSNAVSVDFGSSLSLVLSKSWDVSVLNTENYINYIAKDKESNITVNYEVFKYSLPNWEKYKENPLYVVNKTESRSINNQKVDIEKGTENFSQSIRKYLQGQWTFEDQMVLVTVTSDSADLNEKTFDYINNISSLSQVKNSNNNKTPFPGFVENVYASDLEDISNDLPSLVYSPIEIMADPIDGEITKSDPVYKGGYAKGYKFFAFKSQQLTSIVFEGTPSLVGSTLLNDTGEELYDQDTLIAFNVPETGIYYLIVYTVNNQEGKFRVGINDREQTDVSVIFKDSDGNEFLTDVEVADSKFTGEKEIGIIFKYPNPVEIITEDTIQYKGWKIEFDYGRPGETITEVLGTFVTPDEYQRNGLEPIFKDICDYEEYKIIFQMLQIGVNQILITPNDSLFPIKNQICISNNNGDGTGYSGTRLFTQEVPAAE